MILPNLVCVRHWLRRNVLLGAHVKLGWECLAKLLVTCRENMIVPLTTLLF